MEKHPNWGCLADPELREVVEMVLSYIKKCVESGKQFCDFDPSEHGVPWHYMQRLVFKCRILKITYKSNRYKLYNFTVPLEVVEEKLREYSVASDNKLFSESEKTPDIPSDFWAAVEGYDDLKELFVASLRANDPVHILLIGPPSTGKSLMLAEVERIKGSVFVTAGTSTKAGLRDILLNMRPRILIIDELDKITNPNDLSVLLTLMESQRLIVSKHNEYIEVPMKVWVFAAANRVRGIPQELLDRFQQIYIKPYDKETLKRVITKAVTIYTKKDIGFAQYLAERVVESNGTIREALRLAKIAHDKSDVDRFINIFNKYRTPW